MKLHGLISYNHITTVMHSDKQGDCKNTYIKQQEHKNIRQKTTGTHNNVHQTETTFIRPKLVTSNRPCRHILQPVGSHSNNRTYQDQRQSYSTYHSAIMIHHQR